MCLLSPVELESAVSADVLAALTVSGDVSDAGDDAADDVRSMEPVLAHRGRHSAPDRRRNRGQNFI